MKISIIGHGYVGLVTACVFADFGNQVHIIGRTKSNIEKLRNGDPIIYEPGLRELLEKNIEAGRLTFSLDFNSVKTSKIVFIAVGTPSQVDGKADLSQVFLVAKKIGQSLGRSHVVVSCKSTVPVGTNKKVKQIINKNVDTESSFEVASCPEFLREGTAINDTLHPDRVMIGVEPGKTGQVLLDLHKPISGKKIVTDLASAELIKYASNSILATKISFANLIAEYCEKYDADAPAVLEAVGLDNRVSDKFLNVGIGYGGACFPKDVKALANFGKQEGIDTSLLDSVEKINKNARDRFLDKIFRHLKGKRIAIWGLSFKPNTDDIREAPSRYIIDRLLKKGSLIKVYDQEASEHIKHIFGDKIAYTSDKYEAIDGADGLVILTEWNEFQSVDLPKVKTLLKKPIIFDGRNIFDPKKMKKLGFSYFSVGRKGVLP